MIVILDASVVWNVDGAVAARHVDGDAAARHVEVGVFGLVHAHGKIRDGGLFCSLRHVPASRLCLFLRRLQIAFEIAPCLQQV